jgi:hypothetical protein
MEEARGAEQTINNDRLFHKNFQRYSHAGRRPTGGGPQYQHH